VLIELCPQLSRKQAAALLDRADRSVKTAIVMERLGADPPTARRLLDEHHGMLRPILGEQPAALGEEG
jgi:N-acetylmuramic acid 6-phosphate (MurNAc-6-P) etherase